MAKKKSASKGASKKSQKPKSSSSKKGQVKKSKKPSKKKASSRKGQVSQKKTPRKKVASSKKPSKKKTSTAKKVGKKKVSTQRKASQSKSKSATISSRKPSKTSSRKGPVRKKRSVKKISAPASKRGTKNRTAGKSSSPQASSSSGELTSTDRYNLGGLLACAIDRISDPHFHRLRSALRDLNLTALEKDNLIRLSQGFTIPKLFADAFPLEKAQSAVRQLVRDVRGTRENEKEWKEEIRRVAGWLGIFGEDVELIERRASSKK